MKIKKAARRYLRQLEHRLHEAKLSLKSGGHSHSDEERILERHIGELLVNGHSRTAVDIGAGDGIRWSNTYALYRRGWRGVGFEADSRKVAKLAEAYKFYPAVSLCQCRVTPANVVPLLRAYEIPEDFSVLNLDIDSYDYWVLDALLESFRPRLIVTEINEKIPPPIEFVVKFDPDFELRHHFYGYSIQSLSELCARHDYALIELEYNNAFLAPRELGGVRPLDAADAYRRGYLERPDRQEKFYLNQNMEILHTLSPEEGVKFINQFFSEHRGRYDVGIARPTPVELAHR
ncbi:MAG TPA: hypothetical protein VNA19_00435 [Pyrinomonadaceae bacterium]|nr:hypothetical protein [Pyrinomonadaceae bacterium]